MDLAPASWPRAGVALLERRTTLPPEPQSPRSARRLLREVAAASGRDEWLDVGELAISEVVTNAALHAHTPIEVRVAVFDNRLCVEVKDGSPAVPVSRDYGADATTGRGLGLVAAMALECGVHSLGAAGKIVWFCVGPPDEPDERSADDLLAAWTLDDFEDAETTATPANVVLLAMPATLWLSARQHHDAILRELALYGAEHEVVADFAAADRARGIISIALSRALEAAHDAGLARPALPADHPSPLPWVPADLDLDLCIDASDGPAFAALQDALDAAEHLAVAGRLLMRPGLPEIVAVRDWACEQVIAQLAGAPAAAWPGVSQERFETESRTRLGSDEPAWDASVARDSARRVVAADDANRIVAVSRPLAELLGWSSDDLVGRRVVTIVPPSFREAHVAGFSRHLTTGEAHVIGVPLKLPVLHADGHEILCNFLIERAPTNPGRSIYLAWIEPVET